MNAAFRFRRLRLSASSCRSSESAPLSRTSNRRLTTTTRATTTSLVRHVRTVSSFSSSLFQSSQSYEGCDLSSLSSSRRCFHASVAVFGDYPDHEVVGLPALSPTMEQGTIASWNIQEGDEFSAGDSICSIETDKATVDFEAQDDGVLAKILREGATASDLSVGTPICVVVEDAEDVAAFADFTVEESAAAPAPVSATEAAPSAATSSSPAAPAAGSPSDRTVADDFVLLPSARFLAESK